MYTKENLLQDVKSALNSFVNDGTSKEIKNFQFLGVSNAQLEEALDAVLASEDGNRFIIKNGDFEADQSILKFVLDAEYDIDAAAEEHGEAFLGFFINDQNYWEGNISGAIEAFDESFQGTFNSLADFTEQHLESAGMLENIPAHVFPYIDWESWGNDLITSGDVYSIELDNGDTAYFTSN